MSWFIVFWLIGADGHVFAHDSIHGFGTQADCERFGGRIPVKHGIVRWQCKPEGNTKPVAWYSDVKY